MCKKPNTVIKPARRFLFTINDWTDEDVAHLATFKGSDRVNYMVYGKEIAPDTGMPHLQGYIELSVPLRLVALKALLKSNDVHVCNVSGNRINSIDYCKKDDVFVEIINKVKVGRSDFVEAYELMEKQPDFGVIASAFPEIAIKHHSGVDRVIKSLTEKQVQDSLRAMFAGETPKAWQQQIIDEVIVPRGRHHRKLIWIVDTAGLGGKSWLGDYLEAFHGGCLMENADSEDIAFAYKSEPIVCMDYTRDMSKKINYGVIESLLNGRIFSPKYASTKKRFNPPWVICFANWFPKLSAMSLDRWDIRVLNTGLLSKFDVYTGDTNYLATGVFPNETIIDGDSASPHPF